jgi:hypothetical protein
MSKEKYGFVYIWYDRKHKRFYIGCHWGTEDDGYICSSSWMKQAYKKRSQDFKRRILVSNITDRSQIYIEEQKYLDMIKKEEIKPLNEMPRYYNLCLSSKKPWHQYDEKVKTIGEKISAAKKGKSTGPCSTETRDKISKSNTGKKRTEEMNLANSERSKGRISPNKGKKMSEDQKQKLREINLGKKASDATRKKLSDRLKGRIVSQETRDKIAAANKGGIGRTGQTLSEEHKKKISEAAKRRYTLAK